MDIVTIQQFIATHGYWVLFVGTLLEGETFILLAAVAAHQGLLDPRYLAVVALGGAFLGDQFFFLLGRWRGGEIMARHRRLAHKVVAARRLILGHTVALILLSRFLYGLRIVIPLACGLSRVRPGRFLLLNLVSAIGWTLCFGCLGYYFGGWIMAHLGAVKGLQIVALLLLAVVAMVALITRQVQRRLLAADEEGPPTLKA